MKEKRTPLFMPSKSKEPWIIDIKQNSKNTDKVIITIDEKIYKKELHRETINFLKNNNKIN